MHKLNISRLDNWLEINRRQIASLFGEISALVENVGDTAAHAGSEISAASAQHNDETVGHIFASVITHAFDHRSRARISHCKTLARHAIEKCFAAGGAIERNVANQNIFFRCEMRLFWRIYHDLAP